MSLESSISFKMKIRAEYEEVKLFQKIKTVPV